MQIWLYVLLCVSLIMSYITVATVRSVSNETKPINRRLATPTSLKPATGIVDG